ncbi:glycolipid transfer protein, partial [Opisthorchis viverrini]
SNTQAITTRQSELRLYHNLIVQQIKDLQGHLKVGVVPNMARIDEITGTLNAACTTFLATIDDLMSLIQPTNAPLSGSKVAQSADDPLSGFPSPQSFVRGSVVGPPSAGHSPVSWKTDSALHTWFPTDRAGLTAVGTMNSPSVNPSLYRSNRSNRLHKTFFSTMKFSFVDLRPNMSAQLDQSNSQLPGDFLSALDFAKACRSLFRIFDRISDFSATDAMIGRTFAALQQVQADLLGNLERLEMAIQVYTSQRSARDQNGHDQPPCEPPDSSTISIGTLLRNDLKNDRTADAASFYKAILWLSRSLNFVREFLHLLFTLPPPSPDDVADRRGAVQDDSLSVAATEAYSRCLRSFHQWSLRGVAMIVIKSLPTRSQFLRLLLQDDLNSDSPSQALASGNSTIPVDFTTQPELYVQLEKDARHYSDALGRTLTLIE